MPRPSCGRFKLSVTRNSQTSRRTCEHISLLESRLIPCSKLLRARNGRSTIVSTAVSRPDLRNLQSLQSSIDTRRVIQLAKLVKRARRIVVVGIDLAASLSWHLSYGLMSLGFAAEGPVGGTGNIQKRVRSLTSKDLLIAISFKQGLRETVEAALRAKKQGVPTFGITDGTDTPIARICDSFCTTQVTKRLVRELLRCANGVVGHHSCGLCAHQDRAYAGSAAAQRGGRSYGPPLVLVTCEWQRFV